ncbi:BRO1 domain-containing protein BROX [Halotydeus destructor]|nr:BRO1 domain-containing protein BROX [Halotydeus destructor]
MAHWFHRNPLKATTLVKFDIKMVSALPEAVAICSELRSSRSALIDMLADPTGDITATETQVNHYLSLLHGFITPLDTRGGDSKLRHFIRFKWTHSCLGNKPSAQQDAIYELISICQEYAFWLMKHAAMLSAKDDIKMEDAKAVHQCLKKAAGIFTAMEKDYVGRLLEKPEPGSDLDNRVSTAYVQQCAAEAQEVTIARAIELKHSASLISALANETSKLFLSAASSLKALDAVKFGKWMRYFQFKSFFYEAYAYCYLGDNLLSLEKCGEAIRTLQESEKSYSTAVQVFSEYSKMKGPGSSAKCDRHLFFRNCKPLITRIKDKCDRENGMIFHQKVATDLPPLELKATHGLVTPDEYKVPAISAMWSATAYSAFDLTRGFDPRDPANSKAAASVEGDLPPVRETPIPQTAKDPKNNSGCVVQ